MIKEDIITSVVNETEFSRGTVTFVIEVFLANIATAMAEGKKVSFRNFGTFEAKRRAPRIGRNPHTGAPVKIPSRVVPYFTASKTLKDMVINQG